MQRDQPDYRTIFKGRLLVRIGFAQMGTYGFQCATRLRLAIEPIRKRNPGYAA